MKRQTTATLGAALLGGATFALAPAAHATEITNPSNDPAAYITFTYNGQSYTDGYDTLPGSDDYACTPIPGVTFDFADNEIDYPNGATRHWTDWSRISSYATWKKQQDAASSTPTPSAKPTSKPSSKPTTKPTTKPKPGTTSGSKSGGSKATPTSTASVTATADPSASASATVDPSATASTSPTATTSSSAGVASASPSVEPSASSAPTVDASPVAAAVAPDLNASVKKSVGTGSRDTSLAGLGILGALVIAGAGLLGGDAVRRALVAGRRH